MSIETYRVPGNNLTKCKIATDKVNKAIYIVDCDIDDTTTVTNSIEFIQDKILERHELSGKRTEWIWFIQGTDRIISQFEYPDKFTNPPFESLGFLRNLCDYMEQN